MPRGESSGFPERVAGGVPREDHELDFRDILPLHGLAYMGNQLGCNTPMSRGRTDSCVVNVASSSVMTGENGAENVAIIGLRDKARGRVSFKEPSDTFRRIVDIVESHAGARLPQCQQLGKVVGSHQAYADRDTGGGVCACGVSVGVR